MTSSPTLLDTNTIIRFLTDNTPAHSQKVIKLFQKSTYKSLFIPDLIVAEIIFVLQSFYKLEREEIVDKLSHLINYPKIKTNKRLIKTSLKFFSTKNISFPDAYLAALLDNKKYPQAYTFDQKLLKIKTLPFKQP